MLTVEGDRAPAAGLVNFGLHPAILDYENWLYSADYIGYLDEALRKIVQDDFTTLFFNGCCGNVNHINHADPPARGAAIPPRSGWATSWRPRSRRRCGRAVPVEGERPGVSRELVELERFQIPDPLLCGSEAVPGNRAADPAGGHGRPGLQARRARCGSRCASSRQSPTGSRSWRMRIGPVGIVALPGEVFCETGLAIKKGQPGGTHGSDRAGQRRRGLSADAGGLRTGRLRGDSRRDGLRAGLRREARRVRYAAAKGIVRRQRQITQASNPPMEAQSRRRCRCWHQAKAPKGRKR